MANTFGIHTPDQRVRDIIGQLLHVAISAIQVPDATACGLAYKLIDKTIDLYPSLSRQLYGPIVCYDRAPEEVSAEIAWVSKTLERLQDELRRVTLLDADRGSHSNAD